MENLHFEGQDLFIYADELPEAMLDWLQDIGGPGRQDDNVAAFMEQYRVTGDEQDCRDYLRGYGAWDSEELASHADNLERLVWLTGCALHEETVAHFCTY